MTSPLIHIAPKEGISIQSTGTIDARMELLPMAWRCGNQQCTGAYEISGG